MNSDNQVIVKRLPERLDLNHAPAFLREVEAQIAADKPQIVLDCSNVRQIDSAGVDVLLRCMEEVMKQDGDLKLAAVSPEAAVILRLTRIDRVFEIFESVSAAVASFLGFSAEAIESDTLSWPPARGPREIDDTADLDIAG
jgi:anti-anti-sigma factor